MLFSICSCHIYILTLYEDGAEEISLPHFIRHHSFWLCSFPAGIAAPATTFIQPLIPQTELLINSLAIKFISFLLISAFFFLIN